MKTISILSAMFLALGIAASAEGQDIKKCVGADGKVSFSDQPCPQAPATKVNAGVSNVFPSTLLAIPAQPPSKGKVRYIVVEKGAFVLDNLNNLLWKRCQEGKRWDGDFCKGSGKRFSWMEAYGAAGDGWRLPTISELKTLASPGQTSGVWIDTDFFPDTDPDTFWSSTPSDIAPTAAWDYNFEKGFPFAGANRTYRSYVRLVRSYKGSVDTGSIATTPPSSRALERFTLSSDRESVLDHRMNLIWKRCQEGKRFEHDTCTGEAKKFAWDAAKKSAGSGWRLPTHEELKSLVDNTQKSGAINQNLFPENETADFWSSTPSDTNPGAAWAVNFGSGYDSGNVVHWTPCFVRLVKSMP